MFIAVDPDNEKRVLSGPEKRGTCNHSTESVVASLSLSPDDRFLATGSFDNAVRVYDTESGHNLKFSRSWAGPIFWGRLFSRSPPNGRWIASGGTMAR